MMLLGNRKQTNKLYASERYFSQKFTSDIPNEDVIQSYRSFQADKRNWLSSVMDTFMLSFPLSEKTCFSLFGSIKTMGILVILYECLGL